MLHISWITDFSVADLLLAKESCTSVPLFIPQENTQHLKCMFLETCSMYVSVLLSIFYIYALYILNMTCPLFIFMLHDPLRHSGKQKIVGNEESVCLVGVCAVAVFSGSTSVFPCSCISMCLTLSKSLSSSVPQFPDCPTAAFPPVCTGSPFFY